MVTNDSEEREYLKNYFGEEATEYHLARFFLMRQVAHMAYFTFLMVLVSGAGNAIDFESPKPGFREFNDRLWTGEISLANDDARRQYAWVHMDRLKNNFQMQRFEDSLRIVSQSP